MTLFHKKPVKRSCFIYHDESGVVGTSGVFIVGLLFVKKREPIYQKITEIRQGLRFKEEMHFTDVSNPKANKVCHEVLNAVLKEPIWFRGYVFDNRKIDLSYFGTYKKKARYTAYNFFTKETLRIFTKNEENAVVYSDRKSRAVKDNFIYYVKDSINNNVKPPKIIIKHLQAIDSKKDDIMQVADLIIGSINNKVTGNKHPLKQAVRQVAEVEFGKKIRYWSWNFTK
ncbi:MAG: DUF3800 domain-containing protein [Candidatus Omnitrophica bacterium]|nr:DUF3800 domain-containing protein [Candidatus Omnitrophota bacterium]